jgi:hypothetical protein
MEYLKERLNVCENNIKETFDQIKVLQNRHQQLIGYKQALVDIFNDMEDDSLNKSVQSIDPNK